MTPLANDSDSIDRSLSRSRERWHAVFSQAALGITIVNLEGRIEEANATFCSMLGYSLEELRIRTFLDITHPDDIASSRELVSKLLDGASDRCIFDKRYLRKNGEVIWSQTTVTLLRNEAGKVFQLLGVVQDITGSKQAQFLRTRLAAIVEHSDDAIITKTLNSVISSWNPGAERIFGYSADEAIGKSVTMLIPEQHLDEEPEILDRLRRGERIDHYETIRRRKDGALINVSLTVSPIKDESGRVIGASKIARDVTRQKRTEADNARLYEEAQREIANRERAEAALRQTDQRKDEFLATLAHELRNPLAPIRQATLISMSSSASDEQRRWSHEVITRQVHHMSLLLDDLLDISRITRGQLELRTEMANLASIVEAAVETSRPAMDAKLHQFSTELPPTPVQFAADPLRLAQVLSNLLTNAAKYTDPRGTIRLRAMADADFVEFSITDTGVGLPADALSSVFTMFSQVKSSQDRSEGGLGIGLALSKGVVELHGGTIEARSAGPGKGSEFIVRIPRISVPGPAQDIAMNTAVDIPHKRRVLIADDNRDAAESLAMLLEIEGHTVTVVHDGQQAVAAIEASRPDIALLDIGMPEIDGYEVARQVRGDSRGKSTLLVAITGWGQEQDKARAMAAGFDLHFTKPIEPQRLIDLLGSELPAR